MKRILNIAHALVCLFVFFGLVIVAALIVRDISPGFFAFIMLLLLIAVLPGKTPLQSYCWYVWASLDTHWQCLLSPILNGILRPKGHAMFGHPHEFASSVVGKNRETNLGFKWIDRVLSWFDPAAGSHGKQAIQHDERARF